MRNDTPENIATHFRIYTVLQWKTFKKEDLFSLLFTYLVILNCNAGNPGNCLCLSCYLVDSSLSGSVVFWFCESLFRLHLLTQF